MEVVLPKYQGQKFQNGKVNIVEDYLSIEEALQININKKPFTVIMRSPGDEVDMITGLLYNEDIYTNSENINIEIINKNKLGYVTEVNIDIKSDLLGDGYLSSRSLLSVSSCGICGKRELGDLSVKGTKLANVDFSFELIEGMLQSMHSKQRSFSKSGGSHAAAAFDGFGRIISSKEDIGRHNAVDKVVGSLIRKSKLDKAIFISVSGRVSYEIITKVFRAKIPVLIAVSAPSSLAIDFAKELGVTVFAFCRNGKSTRYS